MNQVYQLYNILYTKQVQLPVSLLPESVLLDMPEDEQFTG